MKYNPATFAKTLNWIVAYGPGNQGAAERNTDCRTRRSMSSLPRALIGMISAGDSEHQIGRTDRRRPPGSMSSPRPDFRGAVG